MLLFFLSFLLAFRCDDWHTIQYKFEAFLGYRQKQNMSLIENLNYKTLIFGRKEQTTAQNIVNLVVSWLTVYLQK